MDFKLIDDIDPTLKNEHELELKFNTDFILALIHNFQSMDEFTDWEIFVDRATTKLWISKVGSIFDPHLPFIHTEHYFDSKFPLSMVVEAVSDLKFSGNYSNSGGMWVDNSVWLNQRQKWDENISYIKPLQYFAKNGVICHSVYKGISSVIQKRDFVEKKVMFTVKNDDGQDVVILFSSSIPDSHLPPTQDVVRWNNLFNLMLFEKLEDGRTIIQSYSQADSKMSILMNKMIKSQAIRKAEKWYETLCNYLEFRLEHQR